MPKRADLKSILIIGAGPIIIGQACEFDYSGTQACKALREEGYRVILVNSNPATIMTDPDIADATYIEPVCWQTVEKIIDKERPDALLPTMGGQTALNCALDLNRENILAKYGVELIGASIEAIDKAEDRQLFRASMDKIGLATPSSHIACNLEDVRETQSKMGYPIIIRPSFTLGGTGGGIAYNYDELLEICQHGLDASPVNQVLLEQSVLGWQEYEMEVMRDCNDNCIIVCSIENVDPMGVHTGDSITVAPIQTLTDKEYQIMRNVSIAVLREVGVETGGANVQFAVNPDNGELVVIEMNPRVSRSSALASKATGFPIAKIAAKLAVGYSLYELDNEITGVTPASFEPTLDYVVTKIPRFNFEKFPQADDRLTTQMKSVGEVMAIGRTFQESLQKALRSLEMGLDGLNERLHQKYVATEFSQLTLDINDFNKNTFSEEKSHKDIIERLQREMRVPRAERLLYVADAFRYNMKIEEIHECSRIHYWFLAQIQDLIEEEQRLKQSKSKLDKQQLLMLKRKGFSDSRLATLLNCTEDDVRKMRHDYQLRPVYKRVDSCAAEFSAITAYMYSTYEEECEADPSERKKIVILGSGPNRIGQGIEFDYCCVQAVLAMREAGYEAIMVNCNPETVSTDYDISDRLYFEPLTLEDVLEIVEVEKPLGVIVQYGGQTPLKLARDLDKRGVPIIGTSPDAIDLAEDRERFRRLLSDLGLQQAPNCIIQNPSQAINAANEIGYPIIARPSYVLGGRAMEILYSDEDLSRYIRESESIFLGVPIILDSFLSNAVEVDVDAVCDNKQEILIGGIMQHIEQAGVHSGDSACSLPPYNLSDDIQQQLKEQVCNIAQSLQVVGLVNVQFAVQGKDIYVLEVNPRASRTVPFVAKASGVALARIAANCMVGKSLAEQQIKAKRIDYSCVKESVFPFIKLPGVNPVLGAEMKSTGEVMGIGKNFGEAFAKAQLAAGELIPHEGLAFISVRDEDKDFAVEVACELVNLGFSLCATSGTADRLRSAGLGCESVYKVREAQPNIVDMLKTKKIHLIVNTTEGRQAVADSDSICRNALQHKVPYTTTMAGAMATVRALQCSDTTQVNKLQDIHEGIT